MKKQKLLLFGVISILCGNCEYGWSSDCNCTVIKYCGRGDGLTQRVNYIEMRLEQLCRYAKNGYDFLNKNQMTVDQNLADLWEKLNALTDSISQLKQVLALVNKQTSCNTNSCDDIRRQLDDFREKIQRYNERLISVTNDENVSKLQLTSIADYLQRLRADLRRTETIVLKNKVSCSDVCCDLNNFKQQMFDWKSSTQKAMDDFLSFQNKSRIKNRALKNQTQKLQNGLEELEAKVAQHEETLKEERKNSSTINQRLNRHNLRLTECERLIQQLQAAIDELNQKVTATSNALERNKSNTLRLADAFRSLGKDYESSAEKLNRWCSKVNNVERRLPEMLSSIGDKH